MVDSDSNNRGARLRTPSVSTASSGSVSIQAPLASKCVKCKLTTRNKAALKCTLCAAEYHPTCSTGWEDAIPAELKTFKRPGVNWYGVSCFAYLNTFVSLPSVQDNIADFKSQIQDMNNLMCETVSKMKTSYSDALTSAGVP